MDTDQQGVIKLLCHIRFINMAPWAAILDGANANNIASSLSSVFYNRNSPFPHKRSLQHFYNDDLDLPMYQQAGSQL